MSLTFVKDTGERQRRYRIGLFRCDCGRETKARISAVNLGEKRSCGCRAVGRPFPRTHGLARSPEYRSWEAAKARCANPKDPSYKRYGRRGISMCERWRTSFADFYADMGPRPRGTTLDRFPNNAGNYEPGNCRWATPKQQRANQCVT